jgi:hypothetical protein
MTPESQMLVIAALWFMSGWGGGWIIFLSHQRWWHRTFGSQLRIGVMDVLCMAMIGSTGPIGLLMGCLMAVQELSEGNE